MSNHEEIKKVWQRITKIKTFINKYNCKGINFPSEEECENKEFCKVIICLLKTKILEFNSNQKLYYYLLFIIYADLECLIK